MSYHFILGYYQKDKNNNVGEDVEKKEPSCTTGRNEN